MSKSLKMMSKSLSHPHPRSKLADDPMLFGQLFYKKKLIIIMTLNCPQCLQL